MPILPPWPRISAPRAFSSIPSHRGSSRAPFYGDVNVKDKYAQRIKGILCGRVGEPSDIAGPVLFLASPLADYIAGEVLEVSGGLSLMA